MTASANVELARSLYAAWAIGDFRSFDWAHPEIEYVVADVPHPAVGLGSQGWQRGTAVLDAWEGFRGEPDEYRELDDERILVLVNGAGFFGQ